MNKDKLKQVLAGFLAASYVTTYTFFSPVTTMLKEGTKGVSIKNTLTHTKDHAIHYGFPGENSSGYELCLDSGPSDEDRDNIQVKPSPDIVAAVKGTRKSNRRLTLDFSGTYANPSYLLNNAKTWVTIKDKVTGETVTVTNSSNQCSANIKTLSMSGNKFDFLIKTNVDKDYVATVYVEDTRGTSDQKDVAFTVKKDLPPVAAISVPLTNYRDSSGNAVIKVGKAGRSDDGDALIVNTMKYKMDANNDGDFSNDPWIAPADSLTNKEIDITTNKVGKILLDYMVREDLTPDTIKAFISGSDYLTDHKQQTIDVDNLNPHTSLRSIASLNMDLMFAIKTGDLSQLNSRVGSIQSTLNQQQPVSVNVNGTNEMDLASSGDPIRVNYTEDYANFISGTPYYSVNAVCAAKNVYLYTDGTNIYARDYATNSLKFSIPANTYHGYKFTKDYYPGLESFTNYASTTIFSDGVYLYAFQNVNSYTHMYVLDESTGAVIKDLNLGFYMNGGTYVGFKDIGGKYLISCAEDATTDIYAVVIYDPSALTVQLIPLTGTFIGYRGGYVYSAASYSNTKTQTFGFDIYKEDITTGVVSTVSSLHYYESQWDKYSYLMDNAIPPFYQNWYPMMDVHGKVLDNGNIAISYSLLTKLKTGTTAYTYWARNYINLLDRSGNLISRQLLMPCLHNRSDGTAGDMYSSVTFNEGPSNVYLRSVSTINYDLYIIPYDKSTLVNINTNTTYGNSFGNRYYSYFWDRKVLEYADRYHKMFWTYLKKYSSYSPSQYTGYVGTIDVTNNTTTTLYTSSQDTYNKSFAFYPVIGNDRYLLIRTYSDDPSTFQPMPCWINSKLMDLQTDTLYQGRQFANDVAGAYKLRGSDFALAKNNKVYGMSMMRQENFNLSTGTITAFNLSDLFMLNFLSTDSKYFTGVWPMTDSYGLATYKIPDTISVLKGYADNFTARTGAQSYAVVIYDAPLSGVLQGDIDPVVAALNVKGLKCIWIGNSSNQSVGQSIAGATGGTYLTYSSYDDAINQLNSYLLSNLPPKTSQYVLTVQKGQQVSYDQYYFDLENDPRIPSTVQWYYRHIPDNDGLAPFANQWLSGPVTSFNQDGTYYVSWAVKDNPPPANINNPTDPFHSYRRDSIREEIQINVGGVLPPPVQMIDPTLNLEIGGYLKQNRKMTAKLDFTPGTYGIDDSRTTWTYSAISGGTNADVKVLDVDTRNKKLLFKKPGRYQVKVTIYDTNGTAFSTSQQFDIIPDQAPTGILTIPALNYRDKTGASAAPVTATVISPDDFLEYEKFYLTYDSNNDGSFADESKTELASYQDLTGFNLSLTQGVGSYQLTVEAKEKWKEETIPAFVTDSDYLRWTAITNFKIDNIAPEYSLRTEKFVYLVGEQINYISGFTNEEIREDTGRAYQDTEKDPMAGFTVKYSQNAGYMASPDGAYSNNNVNLSSLVTSINKAGMYTMTASAKDDPKNGDSRFSSFMKNSNASTYSFIVHRPPVAQATFQAVYDDPTVTCDFGNLMYLEGTHLHVTDSSYDPDGFAVTTKLSYKVNDGDYILINSGDTIDLVFGNTYTVKVETVDNWGATAFKLYTLKVINNLNLQPYVIPSPQAASEEVTLRLITNPYATSARCVVDGNSIQLALVSQTAAQKTWEAAYTIPATRWGRQGTPYTGVTYTAQFYAVSEGLVELRKDKDYIVETPIDLTCIFPSDSAVSDLIVGDPAALQATTTKYARSVTVTLYKGTPYQVSFTMSGTSNGSAKTWTMPYTPEDSIPEGTYTAEFIAKTPGAFPQADTPEVKEVLFNLRVLKLQNLRITNICDYRWKDLFMEPDRTPTTLQADGIHVQDMPVYSNRQHHGIKLGYAVDLKMDSIGLNHDQDTVTVNVSYYALDKANMLHPVDLYVKKKDGTYDLLENSEYASEAKHIILDASSRSAYEAGPDNVSYNTWNFSLYLPPTTKAVHHNDALDLVNSNAYDYKLLVVFDIIGHKAPDSTYDYTLKEQNWAADTGNIYGKSRPSNLDILGKGVNHGEVFWYNLDETALDDLELNREW